MWSINLAYPVAFLITYIHAAGTALAITGAIMVLPVVAPAALAAVGFTANGVAAGSSFFETLFKWNFECML